MPSSTRSIHANMAHRLDENVITLSMLGTVQSAQHSQSSTRRLLSQLERKWSCLLDEMSWLCDYKTGGKSVTSVAAQATPVGNVFWFASNKSTRLLVKRQLCWMMGELQRLAASDTIDANEVHWRLFKKSVAFSHRRVESYWDRLSALVQHADLNSSDARLASYLQKLVELRDDHEQLCLLAFQYRSSPMSFRLRQHILQSQSCSIWQAIRHYIGRLGSWWNACSILVSTARRDPCMFSEARVKAVCSRTNSGTISSRGRPELAHVEYPPSTQKEQGRCSAPTPVLLAHRWGDSAAADFIDRFQRRRAETIVHVELLILEHFHRHAFEFAEGVRYIGCSKLSCYCCHIYMSVHPLASLPRPCHGNTWTRWAMPIGGSYRKARARDQDEKMLAEMVRQTSREIEIGSFAVTGVKHLESTTGIESESSGYDS